MRSINYIIKSAMLGGMALVLSTSPALAFGENKMANEEPKVEIKRVEENNKAEKVMLQEKKVEENVAMKMKSNAGLGELLGEGLLGEDILGEGLLGIEE